MTNFGKIVAAENAAACVDEALSLLRDLYPCDDRNEWIVIPPWKAQRAIHELQNAKAFLLRALTV